MLFLISRSSHQFVRHRTVLTLIAVLVAVAVFMRDPVFLTSFVRRPCHVGRLEHA